MYAVAIHTYMRMVCYNSSLNSSGFIADRVNLRYFLTGGMLGEWLLTLATVLASSSGPFHVGRGLGMKLATLYVWERMEYAEVDDNNVPINIGMAGLFSFIPRLTLSFQFFTHTNFVCIIIKEEGMPGIGMERRSSVATWHWQCTPLCTGTTFCLLSHNYFNWLQGLSQWVIFKHYKMKFRVTEHSYASFTDSGQSFQQNGQTKSLYESPG